MLPFTREAFLAVFADYNSALWPLQVLAYAIGLGLCALLFRPTPISGRLIAAGLSAMWLWTGIVYHGIYFSTINAAAILFGFLFALQGIALFYAGVVRKRLRFGLPTCRTGWLGAVLILYSVVVYPLIGAWSGHQYPETPMFGITPCPVTIYSFGMLLLTTGPVPRWLLVIPLIWTLVGGSAAFLLRIPQDWPLLFTGLAAVPLLVARDRSQTDAELTR